VPTADVLRFLGIDGSPEPVGAAASDSANPQGVGAEEPR
jgi:hypothetical protein